MRLPELNDKLGAFLRSTLFRNLLIAVGIFLILSFVFQAGIWVGYRRAAFSYPAGERYFSEVFGPSDDRPGRLPPEGRFPGFHGAAGRVVSATSSTLIVADRDGTEKTVLIGDDTIVRRERRDAGIADVLEGVSVLVVGEPGDDGVIRAKLIRIMPAPPAPFSSTTQQ